MCCDALDLCLRFHNQTMCTYILKNLTYIIRNNIISLPQHSTGTGQLRQCCRASWTDTKLYHGMLSCCSTEIRNIIKDFIYDPNRIQVSLDFLYIIQIHSHFHQIHIATASSAFQNLYLTVSLRITNA